MRRFALLVALLVAGCGVHLGDNFGRRTRTVLDAQYGGRNEGSLPISGEDARAVMARHYGRGGQGSLGSQTGSSYATGGTFVNGGGNQTPILLMPTGAPGSASKQLDAVR